MSGMSFASRGSTGVAPVTVWMSALADNFTMLNNFIESAAFASPVTVATNTVVPLRALKFAKDFNITNASFGAFTTAPDGTTNTMRKIVEDSSANQHFIQGGIAMGGRYPIFRSAGIFKAAERTRIAGGFFAQQNGSAIYCGFDLAGGQVAYGAQFLGLGANFFSLVSQEIISLGGGVYLCIADFLITGVGLQISFCGSQSPSFRWLLDDGSGTAAASISYTGDGTSGLYGWKNSILPIQAWKINSTVFFDDFNDPTMANIDLTNSLQPGFDWYISLKAFDDTTWEGWMQRAALNPLPTVNSSVITVPEQPFSAINTPHLPPPGTLDLPAGGLFSCSNNNGVKVGKGWHMPLMVETKLKIGYAASWRGDHFGQTMYSTQWMLNVANGILNNDYYTPNYVEFQPYEVQSGAGVGGTITCGSLAISLGNDHLGVAGSGARITVIGNQLTLNILNGFLPYEQGYLDNTINYSSGGYHLSNAGICYNQTSPGTQCGPPPCPNWTVIVYPENASFSEPPVAVDPTNMHVINHLLLPFDRETGSYGCNLNFCDGIFRSSGAWSPFALYNADFADTYRHTVDGYEFYLDIGYNFSGGGVGNGYDFSLDYVKVMQ